MKGELAQVPFNVRISRLTLQRFDEFFKALTRFAVFEPWESNENGTRKKFSINTKRSNKRITRLRINQESHSVHLRI